MSNDIQQRIEGLGLKMSEFSSSSEPNLKLFSEIHSQIAIIDSLVKFYDVEESQKLQDLKKMYYQHSNDHFIYNSVTKAHRIVKMNQEIDSLFEKNAYLKEIVESQDHLIDHIGSYMDDAEDHAIRSNTELINYQKYLKRRNKFYRIVVMLVLIFLALMAAKIFI